MSDRRVRLGLGSTALLTTLLGTVSGLQAASLVPYVRVDAGYSLSEQFDGPALTANGLGFGDFDESVLYGGGAGFAIREPFAGAPWFGLRLDVTGTYRPDYEIANQETFDDGFFGSTLTARADVENWTIMANAYADIDIGVLTGSLTGLKLYVGGGAGYANNHIDTISYGLNGTVFATEDSETSDEFAFAGMAGLAYEINPSIAIDIGYRYVDLGDVNTSGIINGVPAQATSAELTAHEVQAGLRFSFGVPEPAAPPPEPPPLPPVVQAPPPEPPPVIADPARNYLVFFDWDSTEILPQAQDTIQQAASAAQQLAVTRIDVTGHADRSGSPAYNQGLSERRAQAVGNAMMALGVPAEQIMLIGRGEEQPLVPTPDGVREPQNRRVEIVF